MLSVVQRSCWRPATVVADKLRCITGTQVTAIERTLRPRHPQAWLAGSLVRQGHTIFAYPRFPCPKLRGTWLSHFYFSEPRNRPKMAVFPGGLSLQPSLSYAPRVPITPLHTQKWQAGTVLFGPFKRQALPCPAQFPLHR